MAAFLGNFGLIELFKKLNKYPVHILEGFQQAKTLREEADYYNRWSQTGCEKLIKLAREFLEIAKNTVLPK